MPKCKDCAHVEVCQKTRIMNSAYDYAPKCDDFKNRSRFVELPIKPGEKIYYFDTKGNIYESTVTQLIYGATGFLIDSDVMFNSNLIGERFFFTREAAEKALKERESSD